MLRISWTERKTNLNGKEYEVTNTVKARKLQYLGDIIRGHIATSALNINNKDEGKNEHW